jgi:hypothetical protein
VGVGGAQRCSRRFWYLGFWEGARVSARLRQVWSEVLLRCGSRVNKFAAFCRNLMDSVRFEFKNYQKNTVHKFKNKKNQEKYI